MRLTVERKVPVTWCVPRASVKAPSSRRVRPCAATLPRSWPPPCSSPSPALPSRVFPRRGERMRRRGPAAPSAARGTTAADPTGRWIVVYKNGTNVKRTSTRLAKAGGFTADRTFTSAFRGLTARLNPRQVTTPPPGSCGPCSRPGREDRARSHHPAHPHRDRSDLRSIVRGREDRRGRSARRR